MGFESTVAAVSTCSMSSYEKVAMDWALPSSVTTNWSGRRPLMGFAGFVGHFDVNAD